jgi:hypothetical protein
MAEKVAEAIPIAVADIAYPTRIYSGLDVPERVARCVLADEQPVEDAGPSPKNLELTVVVAIKTGPVGGEAARQGGNRDEFGAVLVSGEGESGQDAGKSEAEDGCRQSYPESFLASHRKMISFNRSLVNLSLCRTERLSC